MFKVAVRQSLIIFDVALFIPDLKKRKQFQDEWSLQFVFIKTISLLVYLTIALSASVALYVYHPDKSLPMFIPVVCLACSILLIEVVRAAIPTREDCQCCCYCGGATTAKIFFLILVFLSAAIIFIEWIFLQLRWILPK